MKRVLILAVLLCGCGATPADQCNDLVEALCAKTRTCIATPFAQCTSEIEAVLPCGNAVDVGALYDDCVGELEHQTCAQLFPDGALVLPTECKSVIKF